MDLLVVCPVCGCYVFDLDSEAHFKKYHPWYLKPSIRGRLFGLLLKWLKLLGLE